ncbi:MAG: carbon storage regulator [Gemmataceae bacterium]|nr:carbon storage regulator [Gemmataceae bacterium]
MLVLGRKVGERLMIGAGVVVTVVAVRGSQVRLGVEAPAEVAIRRDEICRSAAAETPTALREKKSPRVLHCGATRECKEA